MYTSEDLGAFCWYELSTTDVQAAIRFYTTMIGWGARASQGGPMEYTEWTTASGKHVGGVTVLQEQAKAMGAPPNWMGYVATPDCDATVLKAQSLGATVYLPPMDIPKVGRIAVLADPQGAVFALYTVAADAPHADGNAPIGNGDVSWHELMTTDHVKAFEFYGALFGWHKTDAMDSPMGVYQMFGRKGTTLGGMFDKPPEMPAPAWLYYFRVEDVDALATAIQANGGKVLNGPMEVPGGDRILQAMDPQGAFFAAHSTKKG